MIRKLTISLAVLAVAGLASESIGAQENKGEEDSGHRVVRIQAVKDCKDGDNCQTVQLHRIFVDQDGHVEEVTGGDWIDANGLIDVASTDNGEAHVIVAGALGRGFLGVQLVELTADLRTHFGVPENEGVMVSRVVEDSPAAQAGIEVGDIISGVDGERIASASDLMRAISKRDPGESVALELWRDAKLDNTTVTVAERKLPKPVRIFQRSCEGDDCDGPEVLSLCGDEKDCAVSIECDDGECVGSVGDHRQLRWHQEQ